MFQIAQAVREMAEAEQKMGTSQKKCLIRKQRMPLRQGSEQLLQVHIHKK
jgi:hypothetical protein